MNKASTVSPKFLKNKFNIFVVNLSLRCFGTYLVTKLSEMDRF